MPFSASVDTEEGMRDMGGAVMKHGISVLERSARELQLYTRKAIRPTIDMIALAFSVSLSPQGRKARFR
jgi:hypothetical protein